MYRMSPNNWFEFQSLFEQGIKKGQEDCNPSSSQPHLSNSISELPTENKACSRR